MGFMKSTSLVLRRAAQLRLAEQLVDFNSAGVAVVATVDPINGNNTATLTDAVDMRLFRYVAFILSVGVIDEDVDFKLQEAQTAGGAYQDITGKVCSTLAGVGGDSKQQVIFVHRNELTADYFFVKGSVTVGNGTSSLVSITAIGIGPIGNTVENLDLASVDEIVGGGIYKGSKAYLIAADFTPSDTLVLADLTISTLESAGITLSAWEGPVSLPDGSVGMHHNVSAIAGAAPTEETIYGLAIVDELGDEDIIHTEKFDDPVPIAVEGDSVVYELIVPLPAVLETGLLA